MAGRSNRTAARSVLVGAATLIALVTGCSSAQDDERQDTSSEALACTADTSGTSSGCTTTTTPPPPRPPRRPPECCGLVATIGLDIMSCLSSWLPLGTNGQIANMFGQCVANGVNAGLCGGTDPLSITNLIASCISSMPWSEFNVPSPLWPYTPVLSCIGSAIDAAGAAAACGIALYADARYGTESVNGQGAAQTTCVERGMWDGRITTPRKAGQPDAMEGYNICLSCCRAGGGGISNVGACVQNCACAFYPGSSDCVNGPY